MFMVPNFILLFILVASIAGPIVGYGLAWRRFGDRANLGAPWLAGYYGCVLIVELLHMFAMGSGLATINRPWFIAILLFVYPTAFAGQFIGALIYGRAASGRDCSGCGESLARDDHAHCPDCGEPVADDESELEYPTGWAAIRKLAWPRIRWVFISSFAIFFLLLGFHYNTTGRYCRLCAMEEYTERAGWGVPLVGTVIVPTLPWPPDVKLQDGALTRYLDPDAKCSHGWTDLGQNIIGVSYGDFQMHRSPALPPRDYAGWESTPEFEAFIAANPKQLESCREALRTGDTCFDLYSAFFEKPLQPPTLSLRDSIDMEKLSDLGPPPFIQDLIASDGVMSIRVEVEKPR